MVEEVVCKQCGSVDDYTIQFKGKQRCAYCNGCGNFIKNVAYMPPTFYIGKFKGKAVSEVDDIEYLNWFLINTNPKPSMINAIEAQIKKLKGESNV